MDVKEAAPSPPEVESSSTPMPLALIDRLIGRRALATDLIVLSRQRFLVGSSTLLSLLALVFLAVNIGIQPAPYRAYVLPAVATCIVAATPLWLRLADVQRVSLLVVLMLNAALLCGAGGHAWTGGWGGLLIASLPAVTAVLVSLRSGLLNALALLLVTALMYALARPPGQGSEMALFGYGLSMIGLLGMVSLFAELHKNQTQGLAGARDEALALSVAKSHFLSVMSHELRTPMVGVLGAVDLLERTLENPEQRGLAGVLRRSAKAQLQLIGNILDFARIEADQIQLEHSVFDVHRLLSDLSAMFSTAAESKGLTLRVDIADDLPRFVVGDTYRTQQVLGNLVNNAIKFTERGGIRVAARPGADGCVEFMVRDTGIGFIPALREDIFATFVQADNTTARRFGGSGLGLSICRRLVTAMGGTIDAQSRPGHGSTFRVKIPAPLPSDSGELMISQVSQDSQDSQDSPREAPSAPAVGATVLVADDEAVNRLIISAMLTSLGHTVIEAKNGAEALELLKTEEVDIILLDMHMPEIDGPAVADRLRGEGGKWAKIPIIGLTADVVREHLDRYRRHGLDEVLSKPIDVDMLQAAIEQARGSSEAGRSSISGASDGLAEDP